MELNIEMAEALVFKPGDRVLLVMKRDFIAREEAAEISGALRERFPGVDFTVGAGVDSVAVMPADGA